MSVKVLATLTPQVILHRIIKIASGEVPIEQRTCWNQVGLYLQKHPETKGTILLYQIEGDANHVAHAVLVDQHNQTLVDTLRGGSRLNANAVYRRADGQEYVLLQSAHWQ
jgi:hypothetical protein